LVPDTQSDGRGRETPPAGDRSDAEGKGMLSTTPEESLRRVSCIEKSGHSVRGTPFQGGNGAAESLKLRRDSRYSRG